jgi:hypothetical protein
MNETAMSPAEQLAEIAARSNVLRDFNSREVDGGFILNGSVRYVDPATGGVLAQVQKEAVTSDAQSAGKMYANFCATGNFT